MDPTEVGQEPLYSENKSESHQDESIDKESHISKDDFETYYFPPLTSIPISTQQHKYTLASGLPPIIEFQPDNFYTGKVRSKWRLKEFNLPSRKDEFYLLRWRNISKKDEFNDLFVKQHTRLHIPTITEEIYNSHLYSTDWSFEEVKYLFGLCKKFDLRFIVIHDRYQKFTTRRSLEDLKEKFYQTYNIVNNLKRNSISGDLKPTTLSIKYDKVKDLERKAQLQKLYSRTKEQLQEEEVLAVKIRLLRQNIKSHMRQRDLALHLINAPPVNLPALGYSNNVDGNESSIDFNFSGQVKARKKQSIQSSASNGRKLSLVIKEEPEETLLVDDKSQTGASTDLLSPGKKEKIPVGAYLRSSRISPIKAASVNAFEKELKEVGLNTRPFMPSERNCERFEEIQDLVLSILECKKQLDKFEISAPHSSATTRRSSVAPNYEDVNSEKKKNHLSNLPTVQETKKNEKK